jgi:hypothetical protein
MFIVIWLVEFVMQLVMIFIGGHALKVHLEGLTVEQWLICLAFGLLSIPTRYIIVLLPIEKMMP